MWADNYIKQLQAGDTIQFRPLGNSMQGKIESGQLCTLTPVNKALAVDMIVLCKVKGSQYLHLIKAIEEKNHDDGTVTKRYLIGNNKGRLNGWVNEKAIYGICTEVV